MMFFVYMLASQPDGTLHVGVTSDLVQRIWEHKSKAVPGFTSKYGVDRLVWFEAHQTGNPQSTAKRRSREWKRGVENSVDRGRQPAVDRSLL